MQMEIMALTPQPTNLDLLHEIQSLRDQNNILAQAFHIQSLALGRIIALLDPMFVIPETHPLRRADSDRISKAVIDKLTAEALARGDF